MQTRPEEARKEMNTVAEKNTNEEKTLDEIQEELNEIVLESLEDSGIPRNDFFAWLNEHGIEW